MTRIIELPSAEFPCEALKKSHAESVLRNLRAICVHQREIICAKSVRNNLREIRGKKSTRNNLPYKNKDEGMP
jgi:hypothetical protein